MNILFVIRQWIIIGKVLSPYAEISYKVNEVCGEKVVRTTEKSSYETATVKVPYRKYNVLDGDLYKKDVTNKEYNYYFKLSANN